MPGQLDNLRAAYYVLEGRVRVALRTQVGDVERLRGPRDQALLLLASAEQVRVALIRKLGCIL
jgi:hypothetical protein